MKRQADDTKSQPLARMMAPGVYSSICPLFAAASDGAGLVITGGGGGSRQFGVPNYLQAHIVTSSSSVTTIASLDTGEDPVTSLSYYGPLDAYVATLKNSVLLFRIDQGALWSFRVLTRFAADPVILCKSARVTRRGDRTFFLTGGEDGWARVWENGAEIFKVFGGVEGAKDNELVGVDWCEEIPGRFLTLARNGMLRIWDERGSMIYSVSQNNLYGRNAFWIEGGRVVAAYHGARGPSLLALHSINSRDLRSAEVSKKFVISSLQRGVGKEVILGMADGGVHVWNWESLKKLRIEGGKKSHDLPVSAAVTIGEGSLVSVSADFTIRSWGSGSRGGKMFKILFILFLAILGVFAHGDISETVAKSADFGSTVLSVGFEYGSSIANYAASTGSDILTRASNSFKSSQEEPAVLNDSEIPALPDNEKDEVVTAQTAYFTTDRKIETPAAEKKESPSLLKKPVKEKDAVNQAPSVQASETPSQEQAMRRLQDQPEQQSQQPSDQPSDEPSEEPSQLSEPIEPLNIEELPGEPTEINDEVTVPESTERPSEDL